MSFKERYLRGDCSIDMINDYVDMWHAEGEIKKTLPDFLGLSQEEYVCWMISSDEELARLERIATVKKPEQSAIDE